MDNRISLATKYAWSFVGLPYKWGGDDSIYGFDCSGFVIEVLKGVGVIGRLGDWTADGLYNQLFSDCRTHNPEEGCLVFWGNQALTKVVHVEYCLDQNISIGASGGGSDTVNEEVAARRNAFVKIRPFRSRPNIMGFVDPFRRLP